MPLIGMFTAWFFSGNIFLAILLWSTGGNGHVCAYHLGLILLGWDIGHFLIFEHSKDEYEAASWRGKFYLGIRMRM